MGRRGQSITLSISDKDKEQLEHIAREQGMLWGDRPNISRLVEAIARRQLLIGRNHDWSQDRIEALEQVRKVLIDAGQLTQAQAITDLLLERSELTLPLRREVERFLENPPPLWRIKIESYIRRQQPFQLHYQDVAERICHFTIRHAQITRHEQRQYLDCWCEETEGNNDLNDLKHNWSLRLDRISEAAIASAQGGWQSSLDQISVELHLLKRLAFNYETKTGDDEVVEWIADKPQTRKVVRQVSSTFWFFREILRYGEDCVIIAPDSVRDRFKQKLNNLSRLYDNNAGS